MERLDAYTILQSYNVLPNGLPKTTASAMCKAPAALKFNYEELNELFLEEGLNTLLEKLSELKNAGIIENVEVKTDKSTGKTTVSCVYDGNTYEFEGAKGDKVSEPETTVKPDTTVDTSNDNNSDKKFESLEEFKEYLYSEEFKDAIKDAGINNISDDNRKSILENIEKLLASKYNQKTRKDVLELFKTYYQMNGGKIEPKDFETQEALKEYLDSLLEGLPSRYDEYKADAANNVAENHKDNYKSMTKAEIKEELEIECKRLYEEGAAKKDIDFKTLQKLHEYLYGKEFNNLLNEAGYPFDIESRNNILEQIETDLENKYADETKESVLIRFDMYFKAGKGTMITPIEGSELTEAELDAKTVERYFVKNENGTYSLNITNINIDFPRKEYGKITNLDELKAVIEKKSTATFASFKDLKTYLDGNAKKEIESLGYEFDDKLNYDLIAEVVAASHEKDYKSVTKLQIIENLVEVYNAFVIINSITFKISDLEGLDDKAIEKYFIENKDGTYTFNLPQLVADFPDECDEITTPAQLKEALAKKADADSTASGDIESRDDEPNEPTTNSPAQGGTVDLSETFDNMNDLRTWAQSDELNNLLKECGYNITDKGGFYGWIMPYLSSNYNDTTCKSINKQNILDYIIENGKNYLSTISSNSADGIDGSGSTTGTSTTTTTFTLADLAGLDQNAIDRYFKPNADGTYSLDADTIAEDFDKNTYGEITTPSKLKEAIAKADADSTTSGIDGGYFAGDDTSSSSDYSGGYVGDGWGDFSVGGNDIPEDTSTPPDSPSDTSGSEEIPGSNNIVTPDEVPVEPEDGDELPENPPDNDKDDGFTSDGGFVDVEGDGEDINPEDATDPKPDPEPDPEPGNDTSWYDHVGSDGRYYDALGDLIDQDQGQDPAPDNTSGWSTLEFDADGNLITDVELDGDGVPIGWDDPDRQESGR